MVVRYIVVMFSFLLFVVSVKNYVGSLDWVIKLIEVMKVRDFFIGNLEDLENMYIKKMKEIIIEEFIVVLGKVFFCVKGIDSFNIIIVVKDRKVFF